MICISVHIAIVRVVGFVCTTQYYAASQNELEHEFVCPWNIPAVADPGFSNMGGGLFGLFNKKLAYV